MINNISITGRIVNDIELRETKEGTSYLLLTLAVNKSKDKTNFIPCIAWNKTAELINQNLKKGSLIGVEGELDTYKKDDQTKVQALIHKVSFLESKNKLNKTNDQKIDLDKIKF